MAIGVAACAWLGCGGARTQQQLESTAGGADRKPVAPPCALSAGAGDASIECCVRAARTLDMVLFVEQPDGRFAGARLMASGGGCYRARAPGRTSVGSDHYLAVFEDGKLVAETPARALAAAAAEETTTRGRLLSPRQVVERDLARERAQRMAEASEADEDARPPLTGGRIAGEVLLGGVVGFPALVAGAFIGVAIGKPIEDCEGEEFCGLGSALVGAYVGATVGYSAGVYAAGCVGDQTGSFGTTLVGGLGGAAIGVGLTAALGEVGAVFLFLPAVTAVVGFNVSRRYEEGRAPVLGSLVQVEGGEVVLGVPLPVADPAAGALVVPLAGGRF